MQVLYKEAKTRIIALTKHPDSFGAQFTLLWRKVDVRQFLDFVGIYPLSLNKRRRTAFACRLCLLRFVE